MKYESIIIETDTGSRNRLKQAALAVPEFGKVEFQSSPAEAIYRLNNGPERCDLVFISYRFDQASIMSFIREAKNAKQGQDAAFIMILESDDNDASKVATNMLVATFEASLSSDSRIIINAASCPCLAFFASRIKLMIEAWSKR